jgi:CHASE3 domain sensor protein
MRSRIPPLLPTYFLLVLVVLFAAGSLWIGLERLDAIERLAYSRAESAMTVQDLQSLRTLVSDVVNSTQTYLHTRDSANLDVFERARRSVSAQLTSLRDRMRGSPDDLAAGRAARAADRSYGSPRRRIHRRRCSSGARDRTRPRSLIATPLRRSSRSLPTSRRGSVIK